MKPYIKLLGVWLGRLAILPWSVSGQWTDKVTDTPSLVQVDFGPYGEYLPGDGESYCVPTSATMSILWLVRNGFTQLGSTNLNDATNLELVIAGLMGTTASGGTDWDGYSNGIITYFNARGISAQQFTHLATPNPDIEWLSTNNINQSIVNFAVGWFYPSPSGQTTNYANAGGHGLTLLAADPAARTITINNPYPASFLDVPNVPTSNPQTVSMVPVPSDWTIQDLDSSLAYSQIITPELGVDAGLLAVLWTGDVWTIQTNALPSQPDYSPQPWTLSNSQPINSNGGVLDVLAPVNGPGGFSKSGEGTLRFRASNSTSGGTAVSDGILGSTVAEGSPFGSAGLVISGDAVISLEPDDSAPADILLQLAPGGSKTVFMSNGSAQLAFARGANSSLTVVLGGYTDGTNENLILTHPAALVLAPGSGWSGLASTERVIVAGFDENLPQQSLGMASPALLVQNNDTQGSLAFMRYDETNGFALAEMTSSRHLPIDQSTARTRYAVDTPQVVPEGATVSAAALTVNGESVSSGGGTTTLQVGSLETGRFSGLILNSGAVDVSVLDFGQASAYLAASGPSNRISSTIQVEGFLTKIGTGTLDLTGSNTFTGSVRVSGGRLNLDGVTRFPTLEVEADSTLGVGPDGVADGPIVLPYEGVSLVLAGGQVSKLTAQLNSVIEGYGIIGANGATNTIAGIIQAGNVPGELVFDGPITFTGTSEYFWTLNALNDDANPGTTPWNRMAFNQNMEMRGTQFFVNFATGIDPDSGDPFWNQPHSWTLLEFNSDYDFHVTDGNFVFASGSFNIVWDSARNRALMQFTPNAPTPPRTTIALSADGSSIIITYAGTLMQAPALSGPWLPVPNATPPTYTVPADSPGVTFYQSTSASLRVPQSAHHPVHGFRLRQN